MIDADNRITVESPLGPLLVLARAGGVCGLLMTPHDGTIAALAHQRLTRRAPKGRQRREVPDRFQQVGFALAVGADEHVDAGSWGQVQLAVVAVVSELQPTEAHSVRTSPPARA